MFRKIPVGATPINPGDILSAFGAVVGSGSQERFSEILSSFLKQEHVLLFDSGIAGFLAILEALKKSSDKRSVILPAYTAPSLCVAVRKVDLRPVLCDISGDTFNIDADSLDDGGVDDALCIVGVHMFGIVADGIKTLKERFSDVPIVEDCAQSLGSTVDSTPAGNMGDVSFFSFNRGKNLPTYTGGCVACSSSELVSKIKETSLEMGEESGLMRKISIVMKILALSLAVRPHIYGTLHPLISRFKDTKPPEPENIRIGQYTDFRAAVGTSIMKRIEDLSARRYENGMAIINGLKDASGVTLPVIADNTRPAFNRLPVVFEDLQVLERVETGLLEAGIEPSRLYLKPLHHIFDLGYEDNDFPNAVYFAEHLLTVPVHPLVSRKDIDRIVEVVTDGEK